MFKKSFLISLIVLFTAGIALPGYCGKTKESIEESQLETMEEAVDLEDAFYGDVLRINPKNRLRTEIILEMAPIDLEKGIINLSIQMAEDGSLLFGSASYTVIEFIEDFPPEINKDSIKISLQAAPETPSKYVLHFLKILELEGFSSYTNISDSLHYTILAAVPGLLLITDSLTGERNIGLLVGDSVLFETPIDREPEEGYSIFMIYLRDSGKIQVNETELDEAEIAGYIQKMVKRPENKGIVIRIDGDVKWGKGMEIVWIARKAEGLRILLLRGRLMEEDK